MTNVESGDGNSAALVAGLDHGSIDAGEGVGKGVEVGGEELVQWEVFAQDVEEAH